MPLRAVSGDGQSFMASECNESIREVKTICPHCSGEMVFVNPLADIIKHFRHKTECPYSTEPESNEHMAMKLFVYNYLKKIYSGFMYVGLEVKMKKRIADVVVGKTVIECQVSNISLREVKERIEDYNEMGYSIMWILHNKNYFDKCPCFVKSGPYPRFLERFIHRLYYGRIYYFFDGMGIVPSHFSYKERIWSKPFDEDLNHTFRWTNHNGYKIAMFREGVWWK